MQLSVWKRYEYYVYTLGYPDGRIFYVGKGKGNRVDEHEAEARRQHTDNQPKVAAIHEIWASGKNVVKRIVAVFEDEAEAYMYEWALMNMTTYAEALTNINRGGGYPAILGPARPIVRMQAFPALEGEYRHTGGSRWGCFKSPRGRVFHEVSDIESFAKIHKLRAESVMDLANGIRRIYQGWIRSEKCPARGLNMRDIITFENATRQPWDDQWELL